MRVSRNLMLTGAVAALAACVPQREAPTPPPAATAPPPTPAPPLAVPAPPQNWADIPLTPGDWHYRDEGQVSSALFGPPASEAAFIVRCDKANGRITLLRGGATTGNTMTVRTSFTARTLPIAGVEAQPPHHIFATLPATDPLLDSMAFSRGRFSVEAPGTPMLVIPAWPEPARVIEDCRR